MYICTKREEEGGGEGVGGREYVHSLQGILLDLDNVHIHVVPTSIEMHTNDPNVAVSFFLPSKPFVHISRC